MNLWPRERPSSRINSRLYWRFLASYYTLVLCIICLLGVLFFGDTVERFRREKDTMLSGNIAVMRDFMETKLLEMDRIAYEINTVVDYMPYQLFQDGYSRLRAVHRLRSYCNANTYLEDIVFYYTEAAAQIYDSQPFMFTSTGTYYPETFWSHIYRFEQWSYEAFLQELPATVQTSFRSVTIRDRDGRLREHCLYLVPLGASRSLPNQKGLLFFLMDRQAIDAIIQPSLQEIGGRLLIYNQEQQEVYRYSTLPEEELPPVDLPEDPSAKITAASISYQGRSINRITAYSMNRQWHFVMDVPDDPFASNLRRQALGTLMWLLPVLVLGILGAHVLSVQNYRPIHRLFDGYRRVYKQDPRSLSGIVSAMEEKDQQYADLSARVEKQNELCQQQILSNLLHGRYEEEKTLQEQMQQCGMRFYGGSFLVLILYLCPLPPPERMRARDSLAKDLDATMAALGISIWRIGDGQNSAITVLLCAESGLDPEKLLPSELMRLAQRYKMMYKGPLQIGMGEVCRHALEIHQSYRKAVDAAAFRFIHSQRTLFSHHEMQTLYAQNMDWYLFWRSSDFEKLLSSSQFDKAGEQIQWILQNIEDRSIAPGIAKRIFQDLTVAVATAFHTLSLSMDPATQTLLDRLYAMEYLSMWAFSQDIQQLLESLQASTEALKQNRGYHLKEALDRYLEAHYSNNGLTLNSIAEDMNASPNHLTRYYKKYSGMPLMKRLNTIRLEKARTLLLTTEDSLDDIIRQTGFVDKNHFIARFKDQYGVPPITYRENKR